MVSDVVEERHELCSGIVRGAQHAEEGESWFLLKLIQKPSEEDVLIIVRDFKGRMDGDISAWPKGDCVLGPAGGVCVGGGGGRGEIHWGDSLGGAGLGVKI